MAENVAIDSDSGAQSPTGVGQADQTARALHAINPNWMEDGHGVRGPQRQVIPPSPAQKTPMVFGIDNSRNSPSGAGTITVQTGPFSGGYTGTVDGVTTITLDERYFLIQDNGGGEVLISLNTTTCS